MPNHKQKNIFRQAGRTHRCGERVPNPFNERYVPDRNPRSRRLFEWNGMEKRLSALPCHPTLPNLSRCGENSLRFSVIGALFPNDERHTYRQSSLKTGNQIKSMSLARLTRCTALWAPKAVLSRLSRFSTLLLLAAASPRALK